MSMLKNRVTFIKGQVFWCSDCDARKVNSDDLASGSFYMFSGAIWNGKDHKTPIDPEKCAFVVYALCPDCEHQVDKN